MKKEVCQYKNDNPKIKLTELSKHFDNKWGVVIGRTTFFDIMRDHKKWETIPSNFNDTIKFKTRKHKNLDEALYQWLVKRKHKKPVPAKVMIRKAKQLGKELNITDLLYSNSWLLSFRKRYVIMQQEAQEQVTPTSDQSPEVDPGQQTQAENTRGKHVSFDEGTGQCGPDGPPLSDAPHLSDAPLSQDSSDHDDDDNDDENNSNKQVCHFNG
jgi:hypothetical protein